MRTFDNRFKLQYTLTRSPKSRCAHGIVENKTFLEESLRCVVTWRVDLGTDL